MLVVEQQMKFVIDQLKVLKIGICQGIRKVKIRKRRNSEK
jgi:hypothetical protein